MGIAVVTGASRGIGLELVRQLARRSPPVAAVCRTASVELEALHIRIESGVDLTAPDMVERLVGRFARDDISLLIHNAGVLFDDDLEALDADSIRTQFEINALAPLRLCAALAPRLSRGAKIALVTSRMGSIGDNSSGGHYGYRMSKAALNAAGKSLAHDLRDRGIAVVMLHPGAVRTRMTGGQGQLEPEQSATGLLARIDELRLETTGRFLHQDGGVLPW